MTRSPWWFTACQVATRGVRRTAGFAVGVLDEVVCFAASKEQRPAITTATYDDAKWYAMDWSADVELFPWEFHAVERLGLTKGSTVLLGAAGGGRELEALARDGLRVLAFEPSGLFANAAQVAANHDSARVWRAEYGDLISVAKSGSGQLSALTGETFDAVILGWGSIGHVLDPVDRVAVLRAARRLAPDAPLLCSYLGEQPSAQGRRARVRARLRRLRPTMDPGLRFRSGIGFFHAFQPGEIAGLAEDAGYRVEHEEWAGFPHAILRPDDSPG